MLSSPRKPPALPGNTSARTTKNLALAATDGVLPAGEGPEGEDERLAAIAEQIWLSTRADGAAIAVEENGEVVCRASAGNCAPSVGAVLRRSSGISGYCLRSGQVVLCGDTDTDERIDRAVARTLQIRSVIAVPVRNHGRVVGLVEVLSREPHHFSDEEEGTLHVAAVAVARLLGKDFAPGSGDVIAIAPQPARRAAAERTAEPADESEKSTPAMTASGTAVESPAAEGGPIFSVAEAVPVDVPARRSLVVLFAGLVIVGGGVLGVSLRTRMARTPSAAPQLAMLVSRVNSGDVGAELELAHFYERSGSAWSNPAAALEWLRRAAHEGEAAAQYELAMRYLNGDGVERSEAEAISLLLKSAHQGNREAQYQLGLAYEAGSGVRRDEVKAYACYVMARVNGNGQAEAAQKKLAAQMTRQQIADSRTLLGQMYAAGIGTPVDNVQSYVWFSLAQAAGSRQGRQGKALLAAKMSKEEIAAAAERASELLNGPEQAPR